MLAGTLAGGCWARGQEPDEEAIVESHELIGEEAQKARPGGLSAEESLQKMEVADDLVLELVLAEPVVRQPVFMNFDERGRLWVVQYIQYPHPAGLKIVSHDQYWRNVYDKVPAAPPHHTPGKDKITIHEDTDGDGRFDLHKTFVEGLNMVTAVERGRGGVWVLNPPYLLFYPDADGDDVPDGDPQVHLAGFGLEDSHSYVNSLCWGPDGWLYAAQGSTVTANVTRPGYDETPVFSQGQAIWRYHPGTRTYEIFAEGGGNAFGVEIDAQGRIFSGHNGGDTRGFHYVQGGYLQKGFSKHGPLSNPYAFGYFSSMAHNKVERFTHTFVIYQGGALPEPYAGNLLGAEPLQGRIVLSEITARGGTFQTRDLSHPLISHDEWFRPVDIKVGPEGAVYLADWYDGQVAHFRSHQGLIDPSTGRIYRLRARKPVGAAVRASADKGSGSSGAVGSDGIAAGRPWDLASVSSSELVAYLRHPNKWFRRTALRLLADRRDRSVLPELLSLLHTPASDGNRQESLEALWALNLTGGFDETVAVRLLQHGNPWVRMWTVRLLGDRRQVRPVTASALAALARREANIEVRQQLACSARRLPPADGLPIVTALWQHAEDQGDLYQPLLIWWAVEAFCREDPALVLHQFQSSATWKIPLVQEFLLHRLMQRFALAGSREDLLHCARLLENAPSDDDAQRLLSGLEDAFRGRSLANVPDDLTLQITRWGGGSLALRVRQRQSPAVEEALRTISDPQGDPQQRLQLIKLCGELALPGGDQALLRALGTESGGRPAGPSDASPAAAEAGQVAEPAEAMREIRLAAITALRNYPSDEIAQAIVARYPAWSRPEQLVAQGVLVSRASWMRHLLQAIEDRQVDPLSMTLETLRNSLLLHDNAIQTMVAARWGDIAAATTEEMQAKITRVSHMVSSHTGDPYGGQRLFREHCGKCHRLFAEGGEIGPDLTTYRRVDVDNLALNIINPSAEIREGFENHLLITVDGRVLTGLLVDRDSQVVTLRTADGQTQVIDRDQIDELRVLGRSLMPEQLLDAMSEQQLRDLFAYLRSTQPLNN